MPTTYPAALWSVDDATDRDACDAAVPDQEVGDDLADAEPVRVAGAGAGHGLTAHPTDAPAHRGLARADPHAARGAVAAAGRGDRCDIGAALEAHGDPAAVAVRRERAEVVRAALDGRRAAERRAHLRLRVAQPRARDPLVDLYERGRCSREREGNAH